MAVGASSANHGQGRDYDVVFIEMQQSQRGDDKVRPEDIKPLRILGGDTPVMPVRVHNNKVILDDHGKNYRETLDGKRLPGKDPNGKRIRSIRKQQERSMGAIQGEKSGVGHDEDMMN